MSTIPNDSQSRRQFLKTATACSAPLVLPNRLFGQTAPSNRINVAFIGTGNQGMGLLKRFLKFEIGEVRAVCDVNRGSYGYKQDDHFYGREPAQKMVNDHGAKTRKISSWNGCQAYANFQDVLKRDDIDAVFLIVPDHWHAPLSVLAARAGKDIYCEKPLSLTIPEGQEMIQAVREHQRILQVGSQERSNPVSQFICEKVKQGAIGKVHKVQTVVGFNNKIGPGPGWKPTPIPEGFDYDTWLGPAPQAEYHQDRCLYRFRFNYDYSGGQITNFGAHCNDMAHWGLNLDTVTPQTIECLNAKFLPEGSLFNTATETSFRCTYDNGVELICTSGPESVQVRFEGEDGWLLTGYRGTKASRPELLEGLPNKNGDDNIDPHSRHMMNFIDCVKTRKTPNAPIEIGHNSAKVCHMANAAIRRFPETGPGHVLKWNADSERFNNDDLANSLISRPRRSPWNTI